MRHINFDLDLDFGDPTDRWFSEQILLFGLNTLAVRDVYYLRAHPDTPKLYDSGLIYQIPEQLVRRPTEAQLADFRRYLATQMRMGESEVQHHINLARGVEIFRDIPRIFENGGGDCDNLAAMRSAELVVAGVKGARPYLTCRQQGGRTIYHALVLWPDGSSEDPSRILGMGGVEHAAERREECRKNVERYDNYWQDAKRVLARGHFASEDERLATAAEYKARIDALGLLPKDGVFRVGQRTEGTVIPIARPSPTRALVGIDIFSARRAA